MIYIVNLSGGLTSYEALRRCIARYGTAQTRAVFADTRIEDADLYRFLDDVEARTGVPIVRLADGRTPFDVWHDVRAMSLPSGVSFVRSLLYNCSRRARQSRAPASLRPTASALPFFHYATSRSSPRLPGSPDGRRGDGPGRRRQRGKSGA